MQETLYDFVERVHLQSQHDWLLKAILLFTAFGMGASLGSFLQACVYRIPNDICLIRPRSSCPKCGHQLSWFENFPICGWLWLGGRCRSCKVSIPMDYMIGETIFGLISIVIFLHYFYVAEPNKDVLHWVQSMLLLFWLYMMARIDIKKKIISDLLSVFPLLIMFLYDAFLFRSKGDYLFDFNLIIPILFVLVFGSYLYKAIIRFIYFAIGVKICDRFFDFMVKLKLVNPENNNLTIPGHITFCSITAVIILVFQVNMTNGPLRESALGMLAGTGLLWSVRLLGGLIAQKGPDGKKEDPMGKGDIKLVAAVGYLLGPTGLLIGLFIASFVGTVVGTIHLVSKGRQGIPFGPFIAAGTIVAFELPMIRHYLGF